jgi:hypothetical protein
MYIDGALAEKKYEIYRCTERFFEVNTQQHLDFAKYDHIFQDIEQPEWINYECWCLKNRFGKCNFNKLSTGMKNLMNYLFFAENYYKYPKLQKYILDMSCMGPNAFYYLFKYANYFEIPFYFDNAMMGVLDYPEENARETDPILMVDLQKVDYELDEVKCKDVWEFLDRYEERKREIDEETRHRIYMEDKEYYDQLYEDILEKLRKEWDH